MSTDQSKQSINTERGRRSFMQQLVVGGTAGAVAALGGTSASAQGFNIGRSTRRNFQDIQRHENDHVVFLENALGASRRPKPTFQNLQQRNVRAFFEVSQDLENTGCGAYLGAAPNILSRQFLAAAGSIALIEARHAGWVNTLVGDPITLDVRNMEQSFEQPLTPAEVVALAGPFVASLNGGPPLTYSTTPSAANDVAILNFALALEYLEAEFYNVNVPALF